METFNDILNFTKALTENSKNCQILEEDNEFVLIIHFDNCTSWIVAVSPSEENEGFDISLSVKSPQENEANICYDLLCLLSNDQISRHTSWEENDLLPLTKNNIKLIIDMSVAWQSMQKKFNKLDFYNFINF